jgi:hypothetical protein
MDFRYNGQTIQWTLHAEGYEFRRGFTKIEVEQAIRSSDWVFNSKGRLECRKNFPFNNVWNQRFYSMKQVRPIFVVEGEVITIITVYAYFFNYEN